jgi:predicted membrane protein
MKRRAFLAACLACACAGSLLAAHRAEAMSFDKEQRHCATCHYWTGNRKVYSQERVTVDVSERARCTNSRSDYRNLWVGTLHVCDKYSRWDQLNGATGSRDD